MIDIDVLYVSTLDQTEQHCVETSLFKLLQFLFSFQTCLRITRRHDLFMNDSASTDVHKDECNSDNHVNDVIVDIREVGSA